MKSAKPKTRQANSLWLTENNGEMVVVYGFSYLIYMELFNYSIRIVLLEHIFNEQILPLG